MIPSIQTLAPKKLIGKRMTMNMVENKTFQLWSGFMPRRKEILNNISNDLFSMQVYSSGFDFKNFNPHALFEKWAAVEVNDFETIPVEMESFKLQGGLYAVFLYKGSSSEAASAFQYIFGVWLPNSGYQLDHRPHFEILGEKYKNNDSNSEEEIWIPIK